MARNAWYADNLQRDYPFIDRPLPISNDTDSETVAFQLPSQTFVELSMVFGLDAAFDHAVDHVTLHAITRNGTNLVFVLRTTADGASNHELRIQRSITAPLFTISRDTAVMIEPEPLAPLGCVGGNLWSAIVVTGELQTIGDMLTDGETVLVDASLWEVEPARIQTLHGTYLRAVTLANADRTHATAAAGCSETAVNTDELIVAAECITGDLQLVEGFNCIIRQDNNANAIVIGAGIRAGAGEPCEEVQLFDDEAAPEDSPYLSGGPGCHQVIRSINGVSATNLTITAGPGFQIQPDTVTENRLIINRSLAEFVLCDPALLSSIAASQEEDNTPIIACDTLNTNSQFRVTVLNGTIVNYNHNQPIATICTYNAILSTGGVMVWTSEYRTFMVWDAVAGAYCGIRWRAKLTCTGTSLVCEILGYPLTDSQPCIRCYSTLGTPIPNDLSITLLLAWVELNTACPCVGPAIATSIKVEQLES